MKYILALAFILFGAVAAQPKCEISENALNRYEQSILQAVSGQSAEAKAVAQNSETASKRIVEPLRCILEIQERGQGFLKYLANSFLRPIMGGEQVDGVPRDARYSKVSEEILKLAIGDLNLKARFCSTQRGVANSVCQTRLLQSVFANHAKGAWGFYEGFCNRHNNEFCSLFLPDENLIKDQSQLLGASALINLRRAYLQLNGKSREGIADRLKSLHQNLPQGQDLRRLVIDQIYQELFAPTIPLGMMS